METWKVKDKATNIVCFEFLCIGVEKFVSKKYDWFHYMRLRLENICKVRNLNSERFELCH